MSRSRPAPRRLPGLLPTIAVAASLALVARISLIWSDVQSMSATGLVISDAQAASSDEATDTAAGSEPAPSAAGGEPAADHAGTSTAGEDEAATPSDAAEHRTTTGETLVEPDARDDRGMDLSAAEMEVLQQLARRRQLLDEREQTIGDRAALLEAAEARIEGKVQELRDLRATLEQLIATYEQHEDAKIASLVKIYENMKPKDAAKIFEELGLETLLPVAEKMKERKLAAIMAKMNPSKAKEVTVELARLRSIPRRGRTADEPAG